MLQLLVRSEVPSGDAASIDPPYQRTEGIGGLAIFARGARRRNLTKPYTIAAAAIATTINNNGAATASLTINWVNQVAAGKGVNTWIRTAAIMTTIT